MPIQEKSQIVAPGKINDGEGWASFESVRNTHSVEHQEVDQFNDMPPGQDIGNQRRCDPAEYQGFTNGFGGDTDVSGDVTHLSLATGYQRLPMAPTDDLYNDEHVDLFYGTVKEDGVEGFVERNNYLDRN